MIRMNLAQLVSYLEILGLKATADYFMSCKNDSVTVDGWIEQDFVKRHVSPIGDTTLWKNVQSNVNIWLPDTTDTSFDSVEEKIQWQYMNGDFED